MFCRICHIVGHKISHNNFKKIEIISGTFSQYKTKSTAERKMRKVQRHANQTTFYQLVDKRNQRGIKKYLATNEIRHNFPKLMECSKSRFKREIYSNTHLPQEKPQITSPTT